MTHDRGNNLADICADLRAREIIRLGCLWCPDLVWEGEFGDVLPLQLEHRRTHHVTPQKRGGRSGFVTDTILADNVARARKDGSRVPYNELDDAA